MHDCEFVRYDCDSSSISANDEDFWLQSMVHSAIDSVTHPVELALYLQKKRNILWFSWCDFAYNVVFIFQDDTMLMLSTANSFSCHIKINRRQFVIINLTSVYKQFSNINKKKFDMLENWKYSSTNFLSNFEIGDIFIIFIIFPGEEMSLKGKKCNNVLLLMTLLGSLEPANANRPSMLFKIHTSIIQEKLFLKFCYFFGCIFCP